MGLIPLYIYLRGWFSKKIQVQTPGTYAKGTLKYNKIDLKGVPNHKAVVSWVCGLFQVSVGNGPSIWHFYLPAFTVKQHPHVDKYTICGSFTNMYPFLPGTILPIGLLVGFLG